MPKKILVFDDMPGHAKTLAGLLALKYNSFHTESPFEAIQIAKREKPHLAFVDYALGHVDIRKELARIPSPSQAHTDELIRAYERDFLSKTWEAYDKKGKEEPKNEVSEYYSRVATALTVLHQTCLPLAEELLKQNRKIKVVILSNDSMQGVTAYEQLKKRFKKRLHYVIKGTATELMQSADSFLE